MLFEGGMHPDWKKILRSDDFHRRGHSQLPGPQGSEIKTEPAGFRNKTRDLGSISETKHNCIQEQVF